MRLRNRPGLCLWSSVIGGLGLVTAESALGGTSRHSWAAASLLFVLVVIAAALCVVASAIVIAIGHTDGTAETGILGGSLLVLSTLGLVHGLTVVGVLYGPNTSMMNAAVWSVPLAIAVGSPLLFRRARLASTIVTHWRSWVAGWFALSLAASALLLLAPSALPAPDPRSPVTAAAALGCLAATLAISYRQLRLYAVGRRRATLVGSLGIAFIGLTTIQWLAERPYSPGFWLVHLLDISGVFVAAASVALGHRSSRSISDALAPVLQRDPLAALELGLQPVVRRFVAALDRKDSQTRDHVVRVGETAMRIGEQLRLPPSRLRHLGIAAILHDVGKLAVDDAILTKPGRLSDDEYDRIKRHTVDGEELLRATGELAEAAAFVRSHHERVDGGGYPDGLAGDQIPLEARIIAAADAYDAIAHTRHYRDGLGHETAAGVLEEHAGSQWDEEVVRALLQVAHHARAAEPVFDRIGRESADGAPAEIGCGCADALPREVAELLGTLTRS